MTSHGIKKIIDSFFCRNDIILLNGIKHHFKRASVCLLLAFTLAGCAEDFVEKSKTSKEDKIDSSSQCFITPEPLTEGTGNLAIFNSSSDDLLLSYSNTLKKDQVLAVVGSKQNGVKVDISQRNSSTVMVFAFAMK